MKDNNIVFLMEKENKDTWLLKRCIFKGNAHFTEQIHLSITTLKLQMVVDRLIPQI